MKCKYFLLSENVSQNERWIILGVYTLALTLFFMPFPRSWSLYPLALTMFFGLIGWITSFKNNLKLFRSKLPVALPLISYFLIHAIALIFDFNLSNVVEKLMFILVPILIFPILISPHLMDRIRTLLLSFIAGIILVAIYQFTRAIYESTSFANGILSFQPMISPGISRFSWQALSSFENPTYLTIKTIWAFTIILFTQKYLRTKNYWNIIFTVILIVFIYFLAVRAGLIILFLIVVHYLFGRMKKLSSMIAFIFLIPVLLFVLISMMRTNERFNYWYEHVEEKISAEKIDWINIEPRTRSWYSTLNLIRSEPLFGVGLNSRDKLAEEHLKQGFKVEADLKLNCHNQFLEVQLALGIPGTLILFWMLLTPLLKRKNSSDPDLILPFMIILFVSMLFESILVRQWGIMFFVLFYCILLIPDNALMVNESGKCQHTLSESNTY